MTIGEAIREYVDRSAPPLSLEEVTSCSTPVTAQEDSGSLWSRWLWLGGAGVVAVVLVALVAVVPADDSSDRQEAVETIGVGPVAVGDVTASRWERVPDRDAAFVPPDTTDVDEYESVPGIVVSALTATPERFVAVGQEQDGSNARAAVWTSNDGLSWQRIDPDSPVFGDLSGDRGDIVPTGFAMRAVTAGDGVLVAVGTSTVDTSTPIAWRQANGDWERFALPVPADHRPVTISGVVHTSQGFTAVGTDNRDPNDGSENEVMVWTSTDGANWSLVSADFNAGEMIRSLTSRDDLIVAVGTSGGFNRPSAAAWTSDDGGTTWTASSLPAPLEDLPVSQMVDIATGPDGFVAVGHQARTGQTSWSSTSDGVRSLADQQDIALWSSVDGHTWQLSADLRSPDRITVDPAVSWGPGGYLIMFTTVTATDIQTSTWVTFDGTSPAEINHPAEQHQQILAATADHYIAITEPDDSAFPAPTAGQPPAAPALQVWQLVATDDS